MPAEYIPVVPLQVRTLREVAEITGLSLGRVQKLEAAALRKIRAEIERQAACAGLTVFQWMAD